MPSGSDAVGVCEPNVQVSGFLFDVKRFYQALVSRFLNDHLSDREVQEEASLNDLLRYLPSMNPLRSIFGPRRGAQSGVALLPNRRTR